MNQSPTIIIVSLFAIASSGCPVFGGIVSVDVASGNINRDDIRVGIFVATAGGLESTDALALDEVPPRCLPHVEDDGAATALTLAPLKLIPVQDGAFEIEVEDLVPGPMGLVAWVDANGDDKVTVTTEESDESCRTATRTIDDESLALTALQYRENPTNPYDAVATPVDNPATSRFLSDAEASGWVFDFNDASPQ